MRAVRRRQGISRTIPGLAAVLVALTLAQAALAVDVPPGFVPQPLLASRVLPITGKPVTVLCADNTTDWNAEEATRSNGGSEILGHTDSVGGMTIYLSPIVCAPLLWKTQKHADYLLRTLGATLEVLAHESEHIAGHTNEGETECAALTVVRSLAQRFGYRDATRLRYIMQGANGRHKAAEQFSPIYIGPCG